MSTRSARGSKAGRRIRRKPEIAEAEILDAARAMLAEGGFRDLTVTAVMERTGMKRAAFYNYFADRNDLVMRLLGRIEDEIMEASAIWFDARGGGVAKLREGLDEAMAVYARHGHVLRAAHEASFHDASVEQYYRHTLLKDIIDAVAKRIRTENRAGRAAVPDPEQLAFALVLMNAAVLAERMGWPGSDPPESLRETIVRIWEQAIYGRGATR